MPIKVVFSVLYLGLISQKRREDSIMSRFFCLAAGSQPDMISDSNPSSGLDR